MLLVFVVTARTEEELDKYDVLGAIGETVLVNVSFSIMITEVTIEETIHPENSPNCR